MAVVVHQQVIRLNVPVHDVCGMNKFNRLYRIITYNF
jgi:hypothetical protein